MFFNTRWKQASVLLTITSTWLDLKTNKVIRKETAHANSSLDIAGAKIHHSTRATTNNHFTPASRGFKTPQLPAWTVSHLLFVFQNMQTMGEGGVTPQELVTNDRRGTALSLKGVVNRDARPRLGADLRLISRVWINIGAVKVKWCSLACCSGTAWFGGGGWGGVYYMLSSEHYSDPIRVVSGEYLESILRVSREYHSFTYSYLYLFAGYSRNPF